MIIFPAIDIKSGRCVRLVRGDASQKTEYGDPCEMAFKWKDAGAEWLHIVDLDGALEEGGNLPVIERITKETGLKIQLGGGARGLEQIKKRMDAGVERIILGTVAVENSDIAAKAADQYPGRIVVSLDSMDGYVRTRGWQNASKVTPAELGLEMKKLGVDIFLYTDISKDGLLSGPDIEGTAALCALGLNIIGSGGVSKTEHILALAKAGCYGVIIGKALYEGRIRLEEALRISVADK